MGARDGESWIGDRERKKRFGAYPLKLHSRDGVLLIQYVKASL